MANTNPYRNFRFTLSIGDIGVAGFSEVTIPDSTTDVIDYREGTNAPDLTYKLSGLTKYGDLTLKNGISHSMALYDWKRSVELMGGLQAQKNITITLYNEEDQETAKWTIDNAWPTKYEASGLNAEGKEVLIQTLTVTHQGIVRNQ